MPIGLYIFLGLIILLLIILVSRIKVVPQSQVYVIERIGSYHQTWNSSIRSRTQSCLLTASTTH